MKIKVGDQDKNEECITKDDDDGYKDDYNPYLYDSKGPRRKIDYSKPDEYDNEGDYVMYDESLNENK